MVTDTLAKLTGTYLSIIRQIVEFVNLLTRLGARARCTCCLSHQQTDQVVGKQG